MNFNVFWEARKDLWRPRWSQDAPRWRQDGPRWCQDAPRRLQDPPKTAQYGSKMLSKCVKMYPRPLKIGKSQNIERVPLLLKVNIYFFLPVFNWDGIPIMQSKSRGGSWWDPTYVFYEFLLFRFCFDAVWRKNYFLGFSRYNISKCVILLLIFAPCVPTENSNSKPMKNLYLKSIMEKILST